MYQVVTQLSLVVRVDVVIVGRQTDFHHPSVTHACHLVPPSLQPQRASACWALLVLHPARLSVCPLAVC